MLSALFGGVCSLYIFLPDGGLWLEILLRLFCSVGMVCIAYGFDNLRRFLRLTAVLYGVSFVFCGAMVALWFLFRPPNLVIQNGVVYYQISPLLLVVSTFFCYGTVRLLRRLGHRQAATAARVPLRVFYEEQTAEFTAMADTGHSLKDLLSGAPVIVVEAVAAQRLLGSRQTEKILALSGVENGSNSKFRVVPYRGVGGDGLLPAVRCPKAIFILPDGPKEIKGPLLALCNTPLGEDYNALFNPEIL